MTNKTYDRLKWITQILLPALGTLYFALSSIWDLPYSEEIVGSLSALTVFLGVLLGITSSQYNLYQDGKTDGDLIIDKSNPEKDIYRLDIKTDLDAIDQRAHIKLQVKPQQNNSQR